MTLICKMHLFETARGDIIECSANNIADATGAGINLIRRRLARLKPGEPLRAHDIAPIRPGGQTQLIGGSIAMSLAGARLPFARWGELARRAQTIDSEGQA